MTYVHMLTDPWAPHPVVNRHICHGMGGGGGGGGGGEEFKVGDAPDVPDYSQYISAMTATGNKLQGYGDELYKWAQEQGVKVSGIADQVSGRAGAMADEAAGDYSSMKAKWKEQYEPLYEAQANEAKRMMSDLPAYQEKEAGRYGADVAQAFDASKAAHDRNLRSYGLKAPGSGGHQLDAMVSNQRGLGQVAAMEQGRNAAKDEAWKRTGEAQQAGLAYQDIANKSGSMSLAAGNQQIGAPESAISTTVGAYNPALSSYQAAYPWMKQWGDTMATGYNQQLAGYSAHTNAALKAHQMNEESKEGEEGGGMMGMLGGIAGTAAGAYFGGPMGASLGGSLGSKLGGAMSSAKGGMIRRYEDGGGVEGDQMVDPSMSQSQGAITDDVPARLNVGEFVFPKDVIEWRGEAWAQKEIMKARKEREANTVAEAEQGPPLSAIDEQAPQFQSGGTTV